MAGVFITGSCDGLGRTAARLVIEQGCRPGGRPVLHARNERRAQEDLSAVPGRKQPSVVIGDRIAQTRGAADQVNRFGSFGDASIESGIRAL
jgi:hypothetical protein